jgi:hypothetical protein
MKLEKIDGIWISEHGRKILEETPDFIQSVWNNPNSRQFWFNKDSGKKTFTKVSYKEMTLVEKSGAEDFEIGRYAYKDEELTSRGFKNTRTAKVYFQKETTLLMENLEQLYERLNPIHEWNLNDEAADSFWRLCCYGESMEFAKDSEGNLIIFDPHCQIIKM